MVSPQNWLFLKTYRKLRERLLKGRTWNLVARLGPGAFETITGHVVNVALNIISAEGCESWLGDGQGWERVGSTWWRRPIKVAEKGELLRANAEVVMSRQRDQLTESGFMRTHAPDSEAGSC